MLTTLGTAALGALGRTRGASAAPATPAANVLPGLSANNGTLFVQTASVGTLTPKPQAGQPLAAPAAPGASATAGQHGAYLVTLHGHSGETIAFADRPRRDYGEVPTGDASPRHP